MTTPALVVQGHTLSTEGKPWLVAGCSECPETGPARDPRQGHAKCSCGAYSEHFTSDAQRKAWHREHKEQVQAARNGDLHVCPRKATARALEVRRLTRKVGRAEKVTSEMRPDLDSLAQHLTHLSIHRLCPVCGHALDPTTRATST